MPIYDFSFKPRKERSAGMISEPEPSIPQKPPGIPDLGKETDITYDPINLDTPVDVNTVLPIGFQTVDESIKNYFVGMKVPTKDDVRELTVRVAGGDKTFLFWKQELLANRIQLPVMSINRTGWRWDATRFSPPYIEMTRRFVHKDGSRIAMSFRPWPCMVDYTFSLWAERKRDIEYIAYQITTRFNPLAEIIVEFEHLRGNIRGKIGEITNNSDIDIGAEELAKVRYDISTTWEAWLPLPEKVVPTILGRVGVLSEFTGEILDVIDFDQSGGINSVSLIDTED